MVRKVSEIISEPSLSNSNTVTTQSGSGFQLAQTPHGHSAKTKGKLPGGGQVRPPQEETKHPSNSRTRRNPSQVFSDWGPRAASSSGQSGAEEPAPQGRCALTSTGSRPVVSSLRWHAGAPPSRFPRAAGRCIRSSLVKHAPYYCVCSFTHLCTEHLLKAHCTQGTVLRTPPQVTSAPVSIRTIDIDVRCKFLDVSKISSLLFWAMVPEI